jgi:DNA-binding transcriptional LysR family regulator
MEEPLETADLLAFATIVDTKSLSRAAAELGVPRTTIGRRLARLEQRLGARLLVRSTRSLVLSDAGEALYRHARLVLDAVAHAEASVRRVDDVIRGDLRVSIPPMPSPAMSAMLCNFAMRYPDVRLQIQTGTQLVDLRRGGYDVALRASVELEPGLVARTVARAPFVAVAAPAYLARFGTPRTAADLAKHRCIQGFARGELPQTQWTTRDGRKLHVDGMFVSNDLTLLLQAALQGLGIALLPLFITHEPLLRGDLVRVLPGIFESEGKVSVVYAERELMSPQVRLFIDELVRFAQAELGGLMDALRRSPECAEAQARERGKPAPRTPPRVRERSDRARRRSRAA